MLIWGLLIIAIGALLFLGGTFKSQFFIYQLLVQRSQILWGKHTYKFHQVSGILVMIMGIAMALGIIK